MNRPIFAISPNPDLHRITRRALAAMTAAWTMAGAALAKEDEVLPVTIRQTAGQVVFLVGDREVAAYQTGAAGLPRPEIPAAYHRGGYLHPLRTPSGKIVSDDYPADHLHHHGVWMSWSKARSGDRDLNFWEVGKPGARVEFQGIDEAKTEGPTASLRTRHRFVDLSTTPPSTLLEETWTVSVAAFGGSRPRHVIDLISTQKCAGSKPLGLPKYHYGGFGIRGLQAWNGAPNCRFLTSSGITDRIEGNGTRGKWCWIGGAVLGHPGNFRFPQPLRIHPKEPFVSLAPQHLGDMEITPGEAYLSRYRLVITDGAVKPDEAESWWQEWAAVP
jgi:Methane oxygenase PmoA